MRDQIKHKEEQMKDLIKDKEEQMKDLIKIKEDQIKEVKKEYDKIVQSQKKEIEEYKKINKQMKDEILLEKFPRILLLSHSILITKEAEISFILPIIKERFDNYFSLRLLFRGSRDGFSDAKFHELCDSEGPLLVIVKTQKDLLIGGFCSISWKNSGNFTLDPKCVVFSITRQKIYNR